VIALLIRWILNTAALYAVALFVPGIDFTGSFPMLFVASLVLGLLNAIVRPILFVLTLPITIVTLGLFLLVLNAAMLGLTAWMVEGLTIHGFLPAVVGALILSIVSFFTSRIGKRD
jgi:putative membrane protein